MKLKITDEKLDELAWEYIFKNFETDSESHEKTYSDGFRAAEQVHQVTANKLIERADKMKEVLKALDFKIKQGIIIGQHCPNHIWIELTIMQDNEAIDKMMKELKGE